MLDVAIASFKKVMEMDSDPSIEEQNFVVAEKRKEILSKVKDKLASSGILEDAESEWIVSLVVRCKRDELNSEKLVSPKFVEEIWKITNERCSGRPLWYCIGDTEFYGYKLKVDERVLIPRPETELLVEKALGVIDENKNVLDLCTGSGAIAITVKKKTNASVCAVDVSNDALELAKENATLNQTEIEFVLSDMFSGLEGRKFDVIISNPPYIKREEINVLQREVKDFEPVLALDGGEDGYDFYRIIATEAKKYLNDGGSLFLECGIGQAEEISSMLKDFSKVEIIKDYENIDRIIKAVL
jgi:release factor glutamine methyltransferase